MNSIASIPSRDVAPATPFRGGRQARLLLVAALSVATILATHAATASGASVHTGRCDTAAHRFALGHRVSHLRTVLKTRQVWILHTAKSFGDEYFACWRPSGLARRIGFTSGGAAVTDTVIDSFAVDGRYVAFHIGAGGDETYDRFRSFDVESLRARRDTGKVRGLPSPLATKVVVTSTGSIAWLASATLYATDASGTHALTDPADGPVSGLRATGTLVSWTQADQHKTATLR